MLQELPLRGFDEECREFVTEQYQAKGLNLHPEANPEQIVKNDDGTLTLHLKKKSGEKVVLEGLNQVLMATGRKPNTAKLNLDRVSPRFSRCHRRQMLQTQEELEIWALRLRLWVEAAC